MNSQLILPIFCSLLSDPKTSSLYKDKKINCPPAAQVSQTFQSVKAESADKVIATSNNSNFGVVIKNLRGLPICVKANSVPESQANLHYIKFIWNRDPFERAIVAQVKTNASPSEFAKDCNVLRTEPIDGSTQELLEKYDSNKNSESIQTVESNSVEVGGLAWDSDTNDLLEQIRFGSNLAFPKNVKNGSDYFKLKKITVFTRELNIQLTRAFGARFASEVYKSYLLNKPENNEFQNEILKKIEHYRKVNPIDISNFRNSYVFVLVPGFAHNLQNNGRYRDFVNDLNRLGLKVKQVATKPFGSLVENEELVVKDLKSIIKTGKKIIVFAGSKGGTEALGAISRIENEYYNLHQGDADRKIVALISLSSVIDGSFVIDNLMKSKLWPIIKFAAYRTMNAQGAGLKSMGELENMSDMGIKGTQAFLKTRMPARKIRAICINLIGIQFGNGLSNDMDIRTLQERFVRDAYPNYGANDGYVEYPGTQVSDSWFERTFTLAIDSSHPLLDGSFNGMNLSSATNRMYLFGALLESLNQLDLDTQSR